MSFSHKSRKMSYLYVLELGWNKFILVTDFKPYYGMSYLKFQIYHN